MILQKRSNPLYQCYIKTSNGIVCFSIACPTFSFWNASSRLANEERDDTKGWNKRVVERERKKKQSSSAQGQYQKRRLASDPNLNINTLLSLHFLLLFLSPIVKLLRKKKSNV
jgi:hypothetical protein